jgi:hypothetical protein
VDISHAGGVIEFQFTALDRLGKLGHSVVRGLLRILDGGMVVGEVSDVFNVGGHGPAGGQENEQADSQNRQGSALHAVMDSQLHIQSVSVSFDYLTKPALDLT